jgi:hypothetical protein
MAAGFSPHGPRFSCGDAVRVLSLGKPGHIRTPDYILGQVGEVIQFCGCFLNPEDLSIGRTSGPVVALYRVRFALRAIWDEPQHHPDDALCIEIYEHWLTQATEDTTS